MGDSEPIVIGLLWAEMVSGSREQATAFDTIWMG